MLCKTAALESTNARLHIYVSDLAATPSNRDVLFIIPGGAYHFLDWAQEGEPVALYFLSRGVSTFILDYSLNEKAVFPRPLQEAAVAMKHIWEHASKYYVNSYQVFSTGFSAGGHLAAALGSCWDDPALAELPGMTPELARPTGVILCYPVISDGVYGHNGSFQRICGSFAPTFLMHTVADEAVPVQNSLLLASAMADASVPFEMHLFPRGSHGLALSNEVTAMKSEQLVPEVAIWPELAFDWMQRAKEESV